MAPAFPRMAWTRPSIASGAPTMRGANRDPGWAWRSSRGSPRSTTAARRPRTPTTVEPWSASSCRSSSRPRRPRPERQLELEAGVRVAEVVAEELAQPIQPVADRLRMQMERPGHRGGVAAVLDIGERRLLHPPPPRRGELVERRQAPRGESFGEGAGLEEEQRGQ